MRLLLGRPAHLLIISLVLSQDFLSHLLSTLVNIRIELVAVLFDGEFLIVINRNVNFFCTNWLLLGVMELSYVRMLQSLFCCQPFGGVELKKTFE
jgi:hypothetical protein